MEASGITVRNSMLLSALGGRHEVYLRPKSLQYGRMTQDLAASASATLGVNGANPNIPQSTIPFLPQQDTNTAITPPAPIPATVPEATILPQALEILGAVANIGTPTPGEDIPALQNVVPAAGIPTAAALPEVVIPTPATLLPGAAIPIDTLAPIQVTPAQPRVAPAVAAPAPATPLPVAEVNIVTPTPAQITPTPPRVAPAVAAPTAVVLPGALTPAPIAEANIVTPAPVQLVPERPRVASAVAVPAEFIVPRAAAIAPAAPLPAVEVNNVTPAPSQLIPAPPIVAPVAASPAAVVLPPAATPAPEAPVVEARPAPPIPTPEALQQNALLINEILRNLRFTPAESAAVLPFAAPSPLLTALQETGELGIIQQNALLGNVVLNNLGFTPAEPGNPLLINATPPALEAAAVTEDLNLIPRNAQFITRTLRDFGAELPFGATSLPPAPAEQALTVAGGAATAASPVATINPATEIAGTVTTAVAPLEPAVTPATVDAGTDVPLPTTDRFLIERFNPANLPIVRFPDRTPYVLAVYKVNDPTPPPPAETEPISGEVQAVSSIGEIKTVGNARLRQVLFRAKKPVQTSELNTSVFSLEKAEYSIRSALERVNTDITARELPLHLVFTKNDNGFEVDVYDCSYTDACRVLYDVPIALDNLPGFLNSLEKEAGIIVDTIS